MDKGELEDETWAGGMGGEVFRHASGWLNVFGCGCGSKQLFLLLGVSFIWMMKNLFEN